MEHLKLEGVRGLEHLPPTMELREEGSMHLEPQEVPCWACALRWQRGGPVTTRSTEACVALISHLGFPANVDRGTKERLDCEVLVGFLCVKHGTAQRRGTKRLVRGHDSGRKASSSTCHHLTSCLCVGASVSEWLHRIWRNGQLSTEFPALTVG